MAGLMDIISRESAVDKNMAETTMLCLKEMKKQSTENVEMVKKINTLVESSIKKIKEYEVAIEENSVDNDNPESVAQYFEKIEQTKVDIYGKLDILKNELEDFVHKENVKCYKNIKSILDESQTIQSKSTVSIKRFLKVILWFLFLISALMIVYILGLVPQ